MEQTEQISLILNSQDTGHLVSILPILNSAKKLLVMTAFATRSGLKLLKKTLNARLDTGLEATFIIGLDFCRTDPYVLEYLLSLSKNPKVTLLVSRPSWVEGHFLNSPAKNFHPKLFIFRSASETSVLLGSANMTSGGFVDNHESSILVRDAAALATSIGDHVNDLIEAKEIVRADSALLAEYARRHAIYHFRERLVRKQIKRDIEGPHVEDISALEGYLVLMRHDVTDKGFEIENVVRNDCRKSARQALETIAKSPPLSQAAFLKLYTPLAQEFWYAFGLQRGKGMVAEDAHAFQDAVRSMSAVESLTTEQAFELLSEKLRNVRGAGINVITEILHSLDNERFALMNKNSLSGLRRAYGGIFPERVTKHDINAAMYADFCAKAKALPGALGLENFTELDSLFNYAYWDH